MSTENTGLQVGQEISVERMEQLSTDEFVQWRRTGELPKTEADTSSAVSPEDAKADDAGDLEEESAEESATSDEHEDEHEDRPKKKGGFQRRIEKLASKLTDKDREIAELRQKLSGSNATETKPEPKPTEAAPVKPKAEDFNSLDEYLEAVTDWKLEQREAAQKAAEAKRQQEAQRAEAGKKWVKQVEAGRTKYDDFDEVIKADVPLSPVMLEAVLESENGSDLAYWLGSHPEDARRIAGLSPFAALREVQKIEAQLTKQDPGAEKEAKKPAPTTKAPAPPTPVKRAAPAATTFDPNDEKQANSMSSDEWAEKRRAQLASRRR